MRIVANTRTVVIVGGRPRESAREVFGDVRSGGDAALFVLGLEPTRAQRRLADEALSLAGEQRFTLTAELIPAAPWLQERLREGDRIRVVAGRRDRRRFGLE